MSLRRVWLLFGWLGVALALVASLGPPTLDEGDSQIDKLAHLAGYGIMMFWWAQIVVVRRWRLALAIFCYGFAIEGLQGLTPDRMPDVLDILANTAGILLGWAATRLLPRLPARLAALPAARHSQL